MSIFGLRAAKSQFAYSRQSVTHEPTRIRLVRILGEGGDLIGQEKQIACSPQSKQRFLLEYNGKSLCSLFILFSAHGLFPYPFLRFFQP